MAAQDTAARREAQYLCHCPLRYMLAKAIMLSALSLSDRMPERFRRSVNVPHKDSVGPDPQL